MGDTFIAIDPEPETFRLILPALIAAQDPGTPGLTCPPNEVKTYVKLTKNQQNEGGLWGTNEQEQLKNVLSYAVRNYTKTDNQVDVTFGKQTERISFCSSIPSGSFEKPGETLRKSIYYNKESIYGAFPSFDESIMSFEGVPKTYVLVESEGLDQWYIPFFVVLGLVLVGVGVGLFLSLRSSPDDKEAEDDQSTKSVKSARVSAVVEPEVELTEVKTETNDAFHTEEEATKKEDEEDL